MVTADLLPQLRARATTEGDLPALLRRLTERAEPVLRRLPPIPRVKAMLSADGGICPACSAPLRFDPWEPDRHACSRCGQVAAGDRHHAHWARAQHLWLAERAAHLAAAGVLGEDRRLGDRARELLGAYSALYHQLPNRDNVLGPSHLFFSTYLESMWVLNYLAAAQLLRAAGWLDADAEAAVNAIADEAANLIGDFNEGMSNRQTWNAAALTAIGVWFGDEELATSAVQSPTGLLGHLTDGFGDDGMWYEGENYHLFAIRGLLTGLHWARIAGLDLTADGELAEHLGEALLAPAATALPDLTFPARRDARFGVSLAQPAYLECWEAGRQTLGDSAPEELVPWLRALYATPLRPAATYDAYLHDAGEPERSATARTDLSWWMLLAMDPVLPDADQAPSPASVLLPAQGLGVLRQHQRYLSLELGGEAGGHGHPDRLHLTLHANGVHWLADPGAGSYVARDLAWYRSTLAHNAPRLDGRSQEPQPSRGSALEEVGEWGWIQGTWGPVRRSVVQGPDWIVDLVELDQGDSATLEVPWHFRGEVRVESPGEWRTGGLEEPFVTDAETFVPVAPGPVRVLVSAGDRGLAVWFAGGELIRARCPGLPGDAGPATLLLQRTRAPGGQLAAVLDLNRTVTGVETLPDRVAVSTAAGRVAVFVAAGAATVDAAGARIPLRGAIPARERGRAPRRDRATQVSAEAMRLDEPPSLDGSLDGFDLSAPIDLADELHYRRSEEPYPGPEGFAATAFVNWDERHLYLAVEVAKPEVVVRRPGDPPLRLDNEADDIHSDGVQVYYRLPDGSAAAWLIRPADDGGIWARPIPGNSGSLVPLEGGSLVTEQGYVLTVALPCPGLEQLGEAPEIEFELVVNEMRPGRTRRAGQLAWAGGGGWVYLRGDRADPAQFGVLELVG